MTPPPSVTMGSPALPGLDEAAFARFEEQQGLVAKLRRDGWERYRGATPPDPRSEEWIRTPLRRFPFAQRSLAPMLPWKTGHVAHPLADAYPIVIEVGPQAITLDLRDSRAGIAGVEILPLIQALDERPGLASDVWTVRPEPMAPDLIDAAMDAFWNAGIWIHAAEGAKTGSGILIIYHPAPGALLLPRLLIHAGAGSEMSITEVAETPAGAAMILGCRQARAERNARVSSVLAQMMDGHSHWLGRDHAWAGPGAQIHSVHVHAGGRTVKVRTGGDAAGEGAHLALSGYALGTGKRHVDQHTAQIHRHADTTSNLLFKCVVKDEAYSLYRGLIAASRGAVRIDAYQKNNNLVLSDGARADSLPGLQIDADDLKCSHGATIGSLDEDQMFYLRSRGLPDADARALLTEAFGEGIISRMPNAKLQEWVRGRVKTELSSQPGS